MDIENLLVVGLVGIASGGLVVWLIIGDYYHIKPTEREKELWKQLAELQALMRVPPLFWHVWERYIHERSHRTAKNTGHRGKHAAVDEPEAPNDIAHPGQEQD